MIPREKKEKNPFSALLSDDTDELFTETEPLFMCFPSKREFGEIIIIFLKVFWPKLIKQYSLVSLLLFVVQF